MAAGSDRKDEHPGVKRSMMTTGRLMGIVLGICLVLPGGAAEPAQGGTKPAPAKKVVKPEPVPAGVKAAYDKHVAQATELGDGEFAFYDAEAEEDLVLTPKGLAAEGSRKLSDTKWLLRGDFTRRGDSDFGEKDRKVQRHQ